MKVTPAQTEQYAALRKALAKELPDLTEAQLAKLELTVDPTESPGGTSVKYAVTAKVPKKNGEMKEVSLTFKPAPDERHFFERDQFANDMRRAADEPAIANAEQVLPKNDHEAVVGWVRPRVGSKGRELSNHAEDWTPEERQQVLVDTVWAEFLGNFDMKTDQYAIRDIGKKDATQIAFNKDWDLALHDFERSESLDRYKTYKWKIPTAQNLLFLSYVHGDVDVDFGAMRDAVNRVQAIPDATVRESLQPFIDKQFAGGGTFGPYKTGDELLAAVLKRKENLSTTFEGFIADLKKEREAITGSPRRSAWTTFKTWLKDERVRILGAVGNSPILDAYNDFNRHRATKAHVDEVIDYTRPAAK